MELWKRLKSADKPIVLYGMGNGADHILDVMTARGISASGVFASDGFVRHQQFRGFTVGSYEELKQRFGDMIVLVCFGTHRAEVMDNVKSIMKEQEVYAPDVPVIGDVIFDEDFLNSHLSEIKSVYDMLSDDLSRKTFENVVRSKLTGEIEPLFDCETTEDEAMSLLSLSENECYLDLGAYTGDTVEKFLREVCGKYRHITAVEPDEKNYSRLVKNTEKLENITCHNLCIDEKDGERFYAMFGGRNSRLQNNKGKLIKASTIDTLSKDILPSYIKFDIEGMEKAALRGAVGTIKKYSPSMQIAAYHRSEDLFEIPLLVKSIRPFSKLYFRHLPSLPAWDCDFYFKF